MRPAAHNHSSGPRPDPAMAHRFASNAVLKEHDVGNPVCSAGNPFSSTRAAVAPQEFSCLLVAARGRLLHRQGRCRCSLLGLADGHRCNPTARNLRHTGPGLYWKIHDATYRAHKRKVSVWTFDKKRTLTPPRGTARMQRTLLTGLHHAPAAVLRRVCVS